MKLYTDRDQTTKLARLGYGKAEWCGLVPSEDEIENDDFEDVNYTVNDLFCLLPEVGYGEELSIINTNIGDGIVDIGWMVEHKIKGTAVEWQTGKELVDALANYIISATGEDER